MQTGATRAPTSNVGNFARTSRAMRPMPFREPIDDDWPVILDIANRAIAHVPGAGPQTEWLENRRTFAARGTQQHFVHIERDEVVGYGAMEAVRDAPDAYRLFVVTAPERLERVGGAIYRELDARLARVGAKNAWFVEFAADERFGAFIRARGFTEARRFALASGEPAIVLARKLDGRDR